MGGVLAGLTVVDIAERAPIGGHMLAQLGARVIVGSAMTTPLASAAGSSFAWRAYAAGKVGMDEGVRDGLRPHQLLARLKTADILFESEQPGELSAIGLGYEALHEIYPRLIHVSITPFGSTGPKALWQESDLILWAAGGPLFPSRDGGRPPLRISVPQAWLHAGADAACGALIAYHARRRSGLGQHVDISVQQSVTQATLAATIASAVGHEGFSFGVPLAKKSLDLSGSGARTRRSKWALRDGLVEMHLGLGPASGAKTNNFFAWMREEGQLPQQMWDWDWVSLPAAIASGKISEDDLEAARVATSAFFATKQKSEIVEEAVRRKILMAPVYTIENLVQSPHHRARGFFQTVQDASGAIALPGDFAKGLEAGFPSLTPAPDLPAHPRRAAEDGSSAPWAIETKRHRAGAEPFCGLKVLDLAWVVAGPAVGRVLADYGAGVIRVESSKRVDTARMMGPFPGGAFDRNRSACFETYNAGKLGLALDLGQEAAREVVRDLVRWADVLVESFAPGQMERWGLGYEVLRTIKPDLIMLSTSLMGQSGPYAAFAGFGNIGAAMSGFQSLVGWPDAPPIGPFGPYTDYVGPRFGLAALLAALHRRAETGQGAWLDVSQAEAGMQFLAPEIAEYSATGFVAIAIGNRDRRMSPHGVFPCEGEDRWIAIAVRDDEDWQALARIIGGEALDPRFASLEGRRREEAELEALLDAWTRHRPVEELEAELQAGGIAAHRASSSADMIADPQLIHRGHYVSIPHENGGRSVIEASRFALSHTPALYRTTAPSLGRDTTRVLQDVLGYGSERIERLEAAGVLI